MEAHTAFTDEFKPPESDEQPSVLQKLQKWGDYDAYGEPVAPTNFLPMKTPLGSEIIHNWKQDLPPRDPLTLELLVKSQKAKSRKLGLILDLSNHETLYAADLKEHDIKYVRVPLVAKILPTQQAINKVIAVADKFWSEHPDQYIAIHCAYGFNRTGFVVCSYLIQACHLSVPEALANFAAARPPGVRHEQFVEELHRRYDSWRRSQPIPHAESFSDLRGFKPQLMESVTSEFSGVADHLTMVHPQVTRGLSTQTPSDILGASPVSPIENEQILKQSLDHVQSISGRSIDAPPSHCESVNNESLDLDERDIFRHFAARSALQECVTDPIQAGRHRRARLSNLNHPAPVGEESTSSSISNSPVKLSQSPFSTIQDIDMNLMSQEPCAIDAPAESGQSQQTAFPAASLPPKCRDETSEIYSRPPLYRGPVSARLSTRSLDKLSGKEGDSASSSRDVKKGLQPQQRQQRPCILM